MSAPVSTSGPRDEELALPSGPRLALRRLDGTRRPFLLVHGLASNARLWDGVGLRLAAAGHEAVAVDLRGHGRSEVTPTGYDTATAAADLALLLPLLGWLGPRAPIVVGQSWGGNVVLHLAARHGGVAGMALVDGGWIRLADRFASFSECWQVLAPPEFEGVPHSELTARLTAWTQDWPAEAMAGVMANFVERGDGTVRARLPRESHRAILRSMWEGDQRALYPQVAVPSVLLATTDTPDPAAKRTAVAEAMAGLPDAQVHWYPDAHHDLHAQQPARTTADLLALAARVDDGR